MLRAYIELRDCRRRSLVNYFGEHYPSETCGLCDNDLNRPQLPLPQVDVAAADRFQINERVRHVSWGEGLVTHLQDDLITVLFDSFGYKTFDAAMVNERDILDRLSADELPTYELAS
jgi:ATP-dependent DNA helicase RecQ